MFNLALKTTEILDSLPSLSSSGSKTQFGCHSEQGERQGRSTDT
jgi:hypothetical protein